MGMVMKKWCRMRRRVTINLRNYPNGQPIRSFIHLKNDCFLYFHISKKKQNMRRSIFTAVLALTAFFVNAQSAEDALKQLDSKKFDKAKEIVDKLTADPNSKNADAWFAKSLVYT